LKSSWEGKSESGSPITTEEITVDTGVPAKSVEFHGGGFQGANGIYVGKNVFRYEGSGEAYLYGGDTQIQGGNYLYGGSGSNWLYGSDIGSTILPLGPSQSCNFLYGGSGSNHLYGGQASAVMTAGPEGSTNELVAGTGNKSSYYLVAGHGSNTMDGEGAQTIYQWQKGDGPLTVTGANPNNLVNVNQLTILGGRNGTGNDTWTVSGTAGGVQIEGKDSDGNVIGGTPIKASGLSELSVDAQPSKDEQGNLIANPGGNTYIVNDLRGSLQIDLRRIIRA
jgi:hypothetical protein